MSTSNQYTSNQSTSDQWTDRPWDDESLLAYYEEKFNLPPSRAPRKQKPPRNRAQKAAERRAELEELADEVGLGLDFETTYTPTRFETEWLADALRPFYLQDLIVDVMAKVKGGKEANVYRCQGHAGLDRPWLAAKVYRPRKLRNLRNDAVYREGRHILTTEDGQAKKVKAGDDQILRALGKSTDYGAQVQHTSWLMWEYRTLQTLHQAGASVPRPWAAGENALLMDYVGDQYGAAPTLHETDLHPQEVEPLFEEIMRNVELMLHHGLIHGDLSAYNVLYWQGSITLIDFPQIVQAAENRNAAYVFRRDVRRICEYFQAHGLQVDANRLADDLWQQYVAPDPQDLLADLSVYESEQDER